MNEKTKKTMNNKKKAVIAVIVLLVVLLVGCILFSVLGKNNEKPNKKEPAVEENTGPKEPNEDTLKDEFGITVNDAINVIKPIFKSDSYEFKGEVLPSSKVKVTVTNKDTEKVYVYEVDPATKKYVLIEG